MDLKKAGLTDDEINFLKTCNVVVIIGLPAAGKTTIAEALQSDLLPRHSIFHSDDYIDYGYKESLYAMLKDISYDVNPKKIIEGVQGYRFLRKTMETGAIPVDAVITVAASPEERQKRYAARGKGNLSQGFEKNLTTVWGDYMAIMEVYRGKKPRFITIFN